MPEKGGLDSLEILRGHGEKDRGEVFEMGVDTPMHTIASPSTGTFWTSSSFDPMGHWSMHPLGPISTSNLPPVLIALTEKGLPFGNGEKEWTGSTFLDWLQGDSHLFSTQGISCSKTPLEQIEFSLLPLSLTSPLIPNPREQFASCSFLWNLKFFVEKVSWSMV